MKGEQQIDKKKKSVKANIWPGGYSLRRFCMLLNTQRPFRVGTIASNAATHFVFCDSSQ
jgi:hypothetical protein